MIGTEIEKMRRFPMPLTFKEQKSLIKKEIKQLKKSKRREKIPEKEIYMRIEKRGGHRYWFVNGDVVGPNQFAEGIIPYSAKEI